MQVRRETEDRLRKNSVLETKVAGQGNCRVERRGFEGEEWRCGKQMFPEDLDLKGQTDRSAM